MIVLSLFDGISCGRVALKRAGIDVTRYYASEVDKHAVKVSQSNWDDVVPIGDVTKVTYKDGILTTENGEFHVGKVDLIIAGSPCQGFSLAGKQLAFDDPRSKLYFEFERLLRETNAKHFLLENVRMKQEHKDVITQRLGVEPVAINSSLVSAQNRYRLYWSNLQITQPADKNLHLQDVVESQVDEKYFIKAGRLAWLTKFGQVKEKDGYVAFNPDKAKCLTVRPEPSWNCTYVVPAACRGRYHDNTVVQTLELRGDEKSNSLTTAYKDSLIVQWPHGANSGGLRAKDGKSRTLTTSGWEHNNLLINEGMVRKLTPVECERLQTLPDGYTKIASDSQRYKMLGNGWTVDVIAHILKELREEP